MKKGEDVMGLVQDAQKLQAERTTTALRTVAREIVADKFATPGALLARADELRVGVDALGPAVEHEKEARRLVADARRVADRDPSLNGLRSALLPLLSLLPTSTRREIEESDRAASLADCRVDRARDQARFPAEYRTSVRRRLVEIANMSPAPVEIVPGLMLGGATSGYQHAHAEKQLIEHDALMADVERVDKLEAEAARLTERSRELRAAALAALKQEFGT